MLFLTFLFLFIYHYFLKVCLVIHLYASLTILGVHWIYEMCILIFSIKFRKNSAVISQILLLLFFSLLCFQRSYCKYVDALVVLHISLKQVLFFKFPFLFVLQCVIFINLSSSSQILFFYQSSFSVISLVKFSFAFVIFNSRISILFFLKISISLLLFYIWWDIVTILSFNSLNTVYSIFWICL